MAVELPPPIKEIQERVVGMYSTNPWPLNRDAEEEMGWRLKCLGIVPEDWRDKHVLDMGCGTGEYALWYATNGARKVTAIDLSDRSLTIARQRKEAGRVGNIDFLKMDILNCELPDNRFDYTYSVGVLHHTGDTYRGFRHLARVTKPGGTVIVSLYNRYPNRPLRVRQWICRMLGADDMERRAEWGQKLFKRYLRKLDKRYHGLNTKQLAYDFLAFPHATFHTASEVLNWFDKNGLEYKGSFAPLRTRDYLYAFSCPEYASFRRTFAGFPVLRFTADTLARLARTRSSDEIVRRFPRPGMLSSWLIQNMWVIFGSRFYMFTLSATKRAN